MQERFRFRILGVEVLGLVFEVLDLEDYIKV